MSLKDIARTLRPSVEEQNKFYLLTRIINTCGRNKSYIFSNVSIGLAALLKREFKGSYNKQKKMVYVNSSEIDTLAGVKAEKIDCQSTKDLEKLLIKLKKGL